MERSSEKKQSRWHFSVKLCRICVCCIIIIIIITTNPSNLFPRNSSDSSGVRAFEPSDPQNEFADRQPSNINIHDTFDNHNQDYYEHQTQNYQDYSQETLYTNQSNITPTSNNNMDNSSIAGDNYTVYSRSTTSNHYPSSSQYRQNRPPSSLMYNDNGSMSTIHPEDSYRRPYDNRYFYDPKTNKTFANPIL